MSHDFENKKVGLVATIIPYSPLSPESCLPEYKPRSQTRRTQHSAAPCGPMRSRFIYHGSSRLEDSARAYNISNANAARRPKLRITLEQLQKFSYRPAALRSLSPSGRNASRHARIGMPVRLLALFRAAQISYSMIDMTLHACGWTVCCRTARLYCSIIY